MVDIQRSLVLSFNCFFCQIVGGKMVHTELFQVKQIRRDVNFQFSLKNTMNLQQNSLIPGVRN